MQLFLEFNWKQNDPRNHHKREVGSKLLSFPCLMQISVFTRVQNDKPSENKFLNANSHKHFFRFYHLLYSIYLNRTHCLLFMTAFFFIFLHLCLPFNRFRVFFSFYQSLYLITIVTVVLFFLLLFILLNIWNAVNISNLSCYHHRTEWNFNRS